MGRIITIEYPDYLANSMRMGEEEFGKEVKISALVKLYELGKISSGTVAKVLKISRVDFLELLARYKVSFFAQDNLTEDWANA